MTEILPTASYRALKTHYVVLTLWLVVPIAEFVLATALISFDFPGSP